jgi:hypothetical protein
VGVILSFCCFNGARLCLCLTAAANGSIVHPQMIHEWIWSSGGMILTGGAEGLWERTCPSPSITLSTTDPTRTVLVANPGLRGENVATNRLSYGTADGRCSHMEQKINIWKRSIMLIRLLFSVLWQRFWAIYHLSLYFFPEDWGDTSLRNGGRHLQCDTASQPRRPRSTLSRPWERQMLDEQWLITLLQRSLSSLLHLNVFTGHVAFVTLSRKPPYSKVACDFEHLHY